MRRVLVDCARKRRRKGVQVSLDIEHHPHAAGSVDVLALHHALEAFESKFPRQARIVELRFFGGLTIKEVAEELEISVATVERDWVFAKAWLYDRINGPAQPQRGRHEGPA